MTAQGAPGGGDALSARSHAYWSHRAPEFAGLRRRDHASPLAAAYRRLLVDHLPPAPARVLDAGTGSGFFALLLAELGHEVVAVDFSAAMLEQARLAVADLADPAEAARITLAQGDLQALGLPDGCVDAVVSRNVTWVLPAPDRAYAELVRVLRPGGTLLNIDANYGAAFAAADAAGEAPAHVSQDAATLRERNDIAAGLWISRADRPAWDVATLRDLGVADVTLVPRVDETYGTTDLNRPYTSASDRRAAHPFAVVARR